MSKLYVIGNGFDLWHGLPTGYNHFHDFAKEFLDGLEEYYSFDIAHVGPWCDFENSLGCFDWSQFYEAYNHIDISLDSFKPSEVYGLEDELTQEADGHVESIKEFFREWISGIDILVAEPKLSFPQNARFITFNYTSTLQSIYGIGNERIFHVHGRAETFDDLIFGHGETMEEEPELDENGDSNRTMFTDAEGAAKYPFYALQKPVNDVIEKNTKFFESLYSISEIAVLGHSLNKIDLPYFTKIAEYSSQAKWLVYCYDMNKKEDYINALVSCGVSCGSIRTCGYEEL